MPRGSIDRPAAGWFVVLDGGIVALSAMALDPRAYEAVRSRFPVPSRRALQQLAAATAAIHLGEALYAGARARQKHLPALRWALQTFIVGFPSLGRLRRAVQPAR